LNRYAALIPFFIKNKQGKAILTQPNLFFNNFEGCGFSKNTFYKIDGFVKSPFLAIL